MSRVRNIVASPTNDRNSRSESPPPSAAMGRAHRTAAVAVVFSIIANSAAPSNVYAGQQTLEPTHAMAKLPTLSLSINRVKLVVELPRTYEEKITGMMFRKKIGENEGMLFAFRRPRQASFWMKNCYIPLTVAYLNSIGEIVELHDLQPLDTSSVLSGSSNIQFALEMPRGWFQRNDIRLHAIVTTSTGESISEIARE
jgi:uncharacterized membrane protein (UPF0127 family)